MTTEDAQTARIKDLETRLAKAEGIVIEIIDMLDAAEEVRVRALSKIVDDIHDLIAAKKGE